MPTVDFTESVGEYVALERLSELGYSTKNEPVPEPNALVHEWATSRYVILRP